MKKNIVSPWAVHLANQLSAQVTSTLEDKQLTPFNISVMLTADTLAIRAQRSGGIGLVFRAAYTPAADLQLQASETTDTEHRYFLTSSLGRFRVLLSVASDEGGLTLHYATYFTPTKPFYVPFWPKEVLAFDEGSHIVDSKADIHIAQQGDRSGMVYFSVKTPGSGSVLYLQNLTAINDYCADTGTKVTDTVDGNWPEFGFALPGTKDKSLRSGKEYGISDTFVAFSDIIPKDQFDQAKLFMDLLARLYMMLPKPETSYHDYRSIAAKALEELSQHKGCWSHHNGHSYLNAYVCDYKTPPELMVQLAVLLPLKEYQEWNGGHIPLIAELEAGLAEFYNKDVGTVQRWLPVAAHQLDGSEEHKDPLIMDSWYLHHPLLNLSRLALHGDEIAKELFLKSLDYTIRVAQHFEYKWPIFYRMDTLEVVKKEAEPGKGGEKDVAGIYAHVMLQAWDLTGDTKYFEEAKRAARSMATDGFHLFYQANNTAFAAGAMLRLWKATKEEVFLDLSHLLMANIFKNVALWDCRYGYGLHFPLFFAVFPLNDAPYTAVYEELEVFAAIHEYFAQADDTPLLRSYALLLAEFIRYALNRMIYYYPRVLPREMLSETVKTGEVDPAIWVPLEDVNHGWEKSGAVGQEVYGAAFPFAVVPRHYVRIADGRYLLFVEYPMSGLAIGSSQATFKILGDSRMACKLYILFSGSGEPINLAVSGKRQGDIAASRTDDRSVCYEVTGDQHIVVKWQ